MQFIKKASIQRMLAPIALSLLCLLQAATVAGQTAIQYVPADAQMVFTVNFKNLDKKVNLTQLQQYDFYNALAKQYSEEGRNEAEQAYFKEVMQSPANLGYDVLEPFYFFVKQEGDKMFLTAVVKLSDRVKYESRLRQLKGERYEAGLSEKEGYRFWQSKDETYAWNDQVVINVWGMDNPWQQPDYGYDPSIVEEYDYSAEDYAIDTSVYVEEWVEEMEGEEPPPPMIEGVEVIMEDMPMEEEDIVVEEAFDPSDSLINFVPPVLVPDYEYYPDYTFEDTLANMAAAADWVDVVMKRQNFQPITANANFRTAFETPHDVHFWMDYEAFSQVYSQSGNALYGMGGASYEAMQMLQSLSGTLYKDAALSMGLSFEDGKMVINSRMFFSPQLSQLYKGMMDGKFNKKMMRYVKGGDEMFGYMYMNLNVKKTIEGSKGLVYDILAQTPQYGQLGADAMQILGIFIDEEAIGNLLRGDLLIAVSGMQTVPVTQTTYEWDADFNMTPKDTTILQSMPIFTMMASYGNEADIMKFVRLGLHSGAMTQEGKYYKAVIPNSGIEFYLALKDGLLIFSNNRQLMLNRLDKGYSCKERISKKHRKLMKENATVMYWNIPNTIRAAAGDQQDSNIGMLGYLNSLGKEFESMEVIGSKTVTNSTSSVMNFNFVKKDANSLEQFFRFVNDMYLEMTGGAKI